GYPAPGPLLLPPRGGGGGVRWPFGAHPPRGFGVDRQHVLGRCLPRRVSRLRSLEYPTDVDTRLPVPISKAGPVAHQTADLWITTVGIDRGNRMARRQ